MISKILNHSRRMPMGVGRKLAVLLLTMAAVATSASPCPPASSAPDAKNLDRHPSEPEAGRGKTACQRTVLRIQAASRFLEAVAFAPDSATLATGDGAEGTVKLWDVSTGRQIAAFRGYVLGDVRSRSLTFSPDGKMLAAAVQIHQPTRRLVYIWDIATKQPRRILEVDGSSITFLAFSPDGKTLATAGHERQLQLWDVATGRVRLTLPRRGIGALHCLSFSPDGKLLATGYANEYPVSIMANGEIDIWDVSTGKQRFAMENRTGIDALAFSPDGRMLASGGRFDERVTLWEVASGMRRATLRAVTASGAPCLALAFAPNGKTLAIGSAKISTISEEACVTLLDVITRRELASLSLKGSKKTKEPKTTGGLMRPVAFTPDARTLAVDSGEGSVTLWRIEGSPRRK